VKDNNSESMTNEELEEQDRTDFASTSSVMRSVFGSVSDLGEFYFPTDIVGGICPHVKGKEEEIVWNAAAEACDSERIHIVWSVAGEKIWYLATASSDLAKKPNSWCPFATLLPTEHTIKELPVCYTYYSEDLAIMMVVGIDELNIFRGSSAIVKAKAERVSQEYNHEVRIINIDPYKISKMRPVPWHSVTLFEERERRVLAGVSIAVGIIVTAVSVLFWLLANVLMVTVHRDYADISARNEQKMLQFIQLADQTRTSPLKEQIVSFLAVNDTLLALNGQLVVYEINNSIARWKAVVPATVTAEKITAMGGRFIAASEDGSIIGNAAQVEFEENLRGKK